MQDGLETFAFETQELESGVEPAFQHCMHDRNSCYEHHPSADGLAKSRMRLDADCGLSYAQYLRPTRMSNALHQCGEELNIL